MELRLPFDDESGREALFKAPLVGFLWKAGWKGKKKKNGKSRWWVDCRNLRGAKISWGWVLLLRVGESWRLWCTRAMEVMVMMGNGRNDEICEVRRWEEVLLGGIHSGKKFGAIFGLQRAPWRAGGV